MNSQKLQAVVCTYLMLLFATTSFGQLETETQNFFTNLSLDPVVTIANKSNQPVQGFNLYYKLNDEKLRLFTYSCPVAPMTAQHFLLPRTFGNDRIAFECWLSTTDGEPMDNDLLTVEGARFLLAPKAAVKKLQVTDLPEVIFPGPQAQAIQAKTSIPRLSILVSAYMSDRNQLGAFASLDKGKFWIKGKWNKEAGADGGQNAVKFEDNNDLVKKYALLVSNQSVDETNIDKYPGIGELIKSDGCKAISTAPEAYPNPFVSTLTISYTLETASTVSISISNPQGQVIGRPLDGMFKEKGKHNCVFNGQALAAGTYYCTIKLGTYEKTIKVVKN